MKNIFILIALMLVASVISFSQTSPPVQSNDESLLLCVSDVQMQKFEAATANCTTAILKSPGRFEGYQARAIAYFNLKNNDAAKADLMKAIELSPDNPQLYGYRGEFYANTEKIDLAIADFSKVLQLAPANQTAFYRRAQMYAQIGKNDLAIADYKAILAISPNHAKTKSALALLEAAPGKIERYSSDKYKVAFQLPNDAVKQKTSTETRLEYFGDKMKFNLSNMVFEIKETKEAAQLSNLLSTDAGMESIANNLIEQLKKNTINAGFTLIEKKRVKLAGLNGLKMVFSTNLYSKSRRAVLIVPVPEHNRYYEFWVSAYDEYFDKWFANAEASINSFEVLKSESK